MNQGDGLGLILESIPGFFCVLSVNHVGGWNWITGREERTSPSKMSKSSMSLVVRPETSVPRTVRSSGDKSRPAKRC